jgi:hypothetical protein
MQEVQDVEPVEREEVAVEAGQGEQVDAPGEAEYMPYGHGEHESALEEEKEPAGHRVSVPRVQEEPAGHPRQEMDEWQ